MAQILAGIITPDPVDGVELTADDGADPAEPPWTYSIGNDPISFDGLLAVRVTVTQDLPPEQHPTQFTMVRWMPDPDATSTSSSSTGQTGSGSSSGGSSASSGAGT
jgi:uncharacterized membrane protein YgcG